MILYTPAAADKIDNLEAEKEPLVFGVEDLEEKLEKKISSAKFWGTDKITGGNFFINRLKTKIEKMKDKVDKIDLQISIAKFEGLADDDSKIGSLAYFKYKKLAYQNNINEIKVTLKNSANIGALNIVRKMINAKRQYTVRGLQKKIKKNDKKIQEQTRLKITADRLKLVQERKKEELSAPQDKKKELVGADNFMGLPPAKEKNQSTGTALEKVSETSPDVTEKNVESVSEINFDSMDTDQLSDIAKLIGINTKIYEVLKKIEVSYIDEQDTSIKTSDVAQVPQTVTQTSTLNAQPNESSGLNKILAGLASIFGPILVKFFSKLVGGRLFKLLKILTLLAGVKGSLMKYLWKSLVATGGALKDITRWITKYTPSLIKTAIVAFEKTILGPIKKSLGTVLGFFKDIGKTITTKVSELVTNVLGKFKPMLDFMLSKWNDIKTFIKGLGIAANLNNLKDSVIEKVSNAKDKVVEIFGSLKDKAVVLKDKAVVKVSAIKEKVIEKAVILKKGVTSKVSKLKDLAKEGLGKVVKFGKGMVQKVGDTLAKKVLGPVTKAMRSILGKAGMKAILKAIPGFGILAGLGFGIHEAIKGNYEQAALEVISGVVGSIPLVGPALGLALSFGGSIILDKYAQRKALSKALERNRLKTVLRENAALELSTSEGDVKKTSGELELKREPLGDKVNISVDSLEINKNPKALEKGEAINNISDISIRKEQMQLQPATSGITNNSINSIQIDKSTDNVNISETFPNRYD